MKAKGLHRGIKITKLEGNKQHRKMQTKATATAKVDRNKKKFKRFPKPSHTFEKSQYRQKPLGLGPWKQNCKASETDTRHPFTLLEPSRSGLTACSKLEAWTGKTLKTTMATLKFFKHQPKEEKKMEKKKGGAIKRPKKRKRKMLTKEPLEMYSPSGE